MGERKEVLTINIRITGAQEVKGTTAEALMISFDGDCDCKLFRGDVLPGGVDTQKQWYGETRTLSARYILEGVDETGEQCRIFIENNGTIDADGTMKTRPRIITDSKHLAWLEKSELVGTIEGIEGGVRIHIFLEK